MMIDYDDLNLFVYLFFGFIFIVSMPFLIGEEASFEPQNLSIDALEGTDAECNIIVKNIGFDVLFIGYSAIGINQKWMPPTQSDGKIRIDPGKERIIIIKIMNAKSGNYKGHIAIWNKDSGNILEQIPFALNVTTTCIRPNIIQQPANATITSKIKVATFTVEADGTPPLKYQWFQNGKEIAGQTNLNYTYVHPDTTILRDKGAVYEYYVNISNQCETVPSKIARLSFRR